MTIEPTKTDKKISLYQLMPPTRKVTWEKNVRSLKIYRAHLVTVGGSAPSTKRRIQTFCVAVVQ